MIISPFLQQLSAHHQFQGNSNDCGPFCTATAINILNQKQTKGSDLGITMQRIRWSSIFPIIRRISGWATFPWGILDILKQEKITAQWLCFQNTQKLIRFLGDDNIIIVIIGNYFPAWSHYKILAAFDPKDGFGFIDSAYRSNELQWDSVEYFQRHWKKFGRQVIRIHYPLPIFS